ncbi:hypothetical protein FRX31_026319 [Thalictrum thalictroides]|uniref:Pentatricopeptide repeat-containing protein n=1 Tax=Thalictrum thalictroides TaxID=46969 RepID=A0A7J6VIT6_THATH|nr:hypothetical protein FRX31_026319 [Thalictrum thalictroides]
MMMDSSLRKYGIQPDICTFDTLINCYCNMGRGDMGFVAFGSILKHGIEPDDITFNTLLKDESRRCVYIYVDNLMQKEGLEVGASFAYDYTNAGMKPWGLRSSDVPGMFNWH